MGTTCALTGCDASRESVTFGRGAVTAGAGWGFTAGDDDADVASRPLVMLGAESRTGRRTKFISENYFVFGESGALISGGLRFFGDRLSADAGLGLVYADTELECCLPLINFVYSFGRER